MSFSVHKMAYSTRAWMYFDTNPYPLPPLMFQSEQQYQLSVSFKTQNLYKRFCFFPNPVYSQQKYCFAKISSKSDTTTTTVVAKCVASVRDDVMSFLSLLFHNSHRPPVLVALLQSDLEWAMEGAKRRNICCLDYCKWLVASEQTRISRLA